MATTTGRSLETVETGSLPPAVRATLRAARRAVREASPGAEEVACRMERPAWRSMMWKLFRYRVGDGDVAGIGTHGSDVYLYFQRGRELDDGSGLLEGGGKTMRFVRLASPADASKAGVRRLLRRAFRLGAAGRSRAPREGARTARKQGAPRRADTREKAGAAGRNASPATIDAYLAGVTGPRRATLEAVRRTIRSAIPAAEECISYGIPAFRLDGKVVAGFAATATGCSYFPFSGTTLDTLAPELAGYGRTKSALHFAADRPLPPALVRKLLRARIAEESSRPASGTARRARQPRAGSSR